MKRLSLILLTLLSLNLASAQNDWFGLRTGYPLGVTIHYGIGNGLPNGFDMRISANLRVRNNNLVDFGLGIDGMNTVYRDRPLEFYVGGGPALDFGGGGILIDVHGLAGGEFRLYDAGIPRLGIFGEVSLGAGLGIGRDSIIPSAGVGFGFNWHLR